MSKFNKIIYKYNIFNLYLYMKIQHTQITIKK